MEMKMENTSFVRVDAETVDKLIEKEESSESLLTKDQQDQLKSIAEKEVPKEHYTVMLEPLQTTDLPVTITRPEFMRRMKEMSAAGGGQYGFMGNMPEQFNVIVNTNHPLISKILSEPDAATQSIKMKQVIDLARLAQNLLKGEELTKFINVSVNAL